MPKYACMLLYVFINICTYLVFALKNQYSLDAGVYFWGWQGSQCPLQFLFAYVLLQLQTV